MTGVIADDLTGAAELGGVGFRFGLKSEVHTNLASGSSADLIALDTASRSCPRDESVRRANSAATFFKTLGTKFIYKKVDSALRGRIVYEIEALMKALGKPRAILLPANPSLNRVIRGGHYYIDGVPIDQTGFGHDPEYPCRTSSVIEILGSSRRCPVSICRLDQTFPERGIIIGEVSSRKDLQAWVSRLDETMLAAGAAEFFTVLLEERGHKPADARLRNEISPVEGVPNTTQSSERPLGSRELFVCGSASDATQSFLKEARARGIPVLSMPSQIIRSGSDGDDAMTGWRQETLKGLNTGSRVIVAIDRPLNRRSGSAERYLQQLINLVEAVLVAWPVDQIFVEGGATASELIKRMKWTCLNVVHEFTQGVVSLVPKGCLGPVLTMKPGSYVWAREITEGLEGGIGNQKKEKLRSIRKDST